MPPLYDNIANAFVLTVNSHTVTTPHTADFDNTGATMETNELTDGEGAAGVWAKFHLDHVATINLSVSLISGTVLPYIDIYRVIDATFNPASPDFSKLSYIGFFAGGPSNVTVVNVTVDPASSVIGPGTGSVNGDYYI
jgi:hypothetical protein